ncbi:uncharacterized protein B0H18DRAFT_878076 [Fomitopsis serialis]|uniref:uncharacterized protein n=1 Tax=Fomitopsis serialis TaxID=139415 RepID=UPI0020074CCC|nr:uncharacterized protein B0H18DRAFT_878076 [Neoantrodia serialis]KAH9924228.1 hypothetical protein B0H18DRAFT_878076 [Neoantrodia serialis]
MKYPLAIVAKMIDVYGNNIKLGYDIACAFTKTVETSSIGAKARAARFSGVVAAFHGYSHNRGCQLDWHPLYMEGVGKEDFEGCERLFSESNALAVGTRLSTAFHRHQAIEEFFGHWAERKHVESASFIWNNYRQALEIIRLDGEVVRVLSDELRAGPAEYENYVAEERAYLRGLKAEPLSVSRRIDYLEVLLKLENAW